MNVTKEELQELVREAEYMVARVTGMTETQVRQCVVIAHLARAELERMEQQPKCVCCYEGTGLAICGSDYFSHEGSHTFCEQPRGDGTRCGHDRACHKGEA